MLIEEPNSDRFRISKEDDIAIIEENLVPFSFLSDRFELLDDNKGFQVKDIFSEDLFWEKREWYTYTVMYSPFQIIQITNNVTTLEVNPTGTLYVETGG